MNRTDLRSYVRNYGAKDHRPDGSTRTTPTHEDRKIRRRKANRIAAKSRKGNR